MSSEKNRCIYVRTISRKYSWYQSVSWVWKLYFKRSIAFPKGQWIKRIFAVTKYTPYLPSQTSYGPNLCGKMTTRDRKFIILWSSACTDAMFHFYPRPVMAFGYCRCLRLSVCVCVCMCVCVSVNHQFVRTITCHPLKLQSPNLDQKCKRPWLRSLLFLGFIDLDLQGQIELKSQNLPHFGLESLSGQ